MVQQSTESSGPSEAGSLAALNGKHIVFITYGSRGDIQPFVALGSQLVANGAEVLMITNVDHLAFVESFNLRVVGAARSCRDDHKSKEFVQGIETGDFMPFFKYQHERKKDQEEAIIANENEAVRDFVPDLIYVTPLTYHNGCRVANELHVPMILGTLFPTTNPFSSIGFRPFRPPAHLTLVHWSPSLTKTMFWQHHSHKVTGFLVVGDQDTSDETQPDEVFGGADQRHRLEEFLASGPAPVYLGWGSMVVPSRTAALAVRALRSAGLRGVILGGWAQLSMDNLDEDDEAEELKAYARDNVFFTASAPHEWLFSRCCAVVHHGGAGTVAASLRSGIPTIVAPCGLDQPDNGRIVAENGCGVALPQYAKLTSDNLAEALKAAVSDETMREKSAELGRKLREEDGLGMAATAIGEYILKSAAEKEAKESRGGEPAGGPPPWLQAARFVAQRWGLGPGRGDEGTKASETTSNQPVNS